MFTSLIAWLTHFMPLVAQKTIGVLMFSEGIARQQWHEMG